jgi:hypothetical protein
MNGLLVMEEIYKAGDEQVPAVSGETAARVKVAAMRVRFLLLLGVALLLIGSDLVLAQPLQPEGGRQFIPQQSPVAPPLPGERQGEDWGSRYGRRRSGRRMGPKALEEQRLRMERAREIAQKLLENPNTPNEVKDKARQLTELLAKRERLAHDLDGKRQDFLRDHGQDLAELRQLRERGEVIRKRLRAAREKVASDNLPAIQEVRRTSQEARNTAAALRRYYRQQLGAGRPTPPGEE